MKFRFGVVVVSAVVFVFLLAPSVARPQGGEERELRMARDTKWNFFVGPYGWLTGVAGTVVTDGEETEIDVPFTDFLDATRAGLMLYFEARRDRIFVAFDGTWAVIGGETEGRFFDLDIEVRQQIYDLRVGYEVYKTDIGEVIHRKKFDWQRRGVIDLYVGGRYFRTEPVITVIPVIGEPREISSADSRVDPFIGFRFGWDMSYRWAIAFRGDIGGFGIGEAAQFSWQASAQLGYRVSRSVTVFGGYRFLDYDTVTGEGTDRNGTVLRQQGPIIGAGIRF